MYKGSSPSNNDTLNVYQIDDDQHNSTPLNKSYNSANGHDLASAVSSVGAASSSKAVLAALRALQDKIRRLEAERSAAIDESVQLRHNLKNMEIEAEHIKQREMLSSQKALQESRSAYEKLLGEKTDMEIKIAKIEEKNQITKATSDELQLKIKALEEERQQGLLRIKALENEHVNLMNLIQSAQQKEKGMYSKKI